jgi:hypothetical protein
MQIEGVLCSDGATWIQGHGMQPLSASLKYIGTELEE